MGEGDELHKASRARKGNTTDPAIGDKGKVTREQNRRGKRIMHENRVWSV